LKANNLWHITFTALEGQEKPHSFRHFLPNKDIAATRGEKQLEDG